MSKQYRKYDIYLSEDEEKELLRKQFQKQTQEILKKQAEQEKQDEKNKRMSKIKSILTSIPLSALGLFEFHLIYFISFLIIALVFSLISNIHILSTLLGWLFRIREDSPDMFAMFLSTEIAYLCFTATIEHISKKAETQKLTLMLTGIYLIVSNVVFLIANIVSKNAILANIFLGIAGIITFYKGKNK